MILNKYTPPLRQDVFCRGMIFVLIEIRLTDTILSMTVLEYTQTDFVPILSSVVFSKT